MRWLWLFVVIVMAWKLVSRARSLGSRRSDRPEGESNHQARVAPRPAQERMVACAHCDLHLPDSEAVSEGGRTFCSQAHRQAFLNATRHG